METQNTTKTGHIQHKSNSNYKNPIPLTLLQFCRQRKDWELALYRIKMRQTKEWLAGIQD